MNVSKPTKPKVVKSWDNKPKKAKKSCMSDKQPTHNIEETNSQRK
jgi:hypothetical protein